MKQNYNDAGQPIGFPVSDWKPPPLPSRDPMEGRWCRLEPLDPDRHAEALFTALSSDPQDKNWTYLAYGPFSTLETFRAWMDANCLGSDPLFFAIRRVSDETPLGIASYLRITPTSGSIEVGHIQFSSELRRTPAATEAMYWMMKRAFELGYRRYEWKCDSQNEASRAAAQRFGFSFEGIFRQATVYKGRNRDTAWYSVIDSEWPALEVAFLKWLDSSNFDSDGRQRTRLSDLTASLH
jgi:RimJ/RimL family protein N-acetyltransferase